MSIEKIDEIIIQGIENRQKNIDKSIVLFTEARMQAERISYDKGLADSYYNLGIAYYNKSNFTASLNDFEHSREIYEKTENKIYLARSFNAIGAVYKSIGELSKSLQNHLKALGIFESLDDKLGIASTNNNLGVLYKIQENFEEALIYFNKALSAYETIDARKDMIMALGNISNLYRQKGNYEKAIEYNERGIGIAKETGDDKNLSLLTNNIGIVYQLQGNFKKALEYFTHSLSLKNNMKDVIGLASTYSNIGSLYSSIGDYESTIKYQKMALESVVNTDAKPVEKDIYKAISEGYGQIGDFELAYKYHIRFFTLQQEMLNQEARDNLNKVIIGHEIEKSQKDAEIYQLRYVDLEREKKMVDEKNRQIIDSIEYSLRIQTAMLPPDALVKEYLPNSFILYMPKDIVAGDFYWMAKVDDLILFAACDCTGHGVPGAMLTVFCNNALNRSVHEFGLVNPASILDKVSELIIDNFAFSEDEIRDGMDISLCVFNFKKMTLQWAGANNPLWIIRNNELIEGKPDKQPIGNYEYFTPFTNHEFELQKGDCIYLFSDGFADQFGGEDGDTKLTRKRFKNLLLSYNDINIDMQKEELKNFMLGYRKSNVQTDDMLVMGILV